MSWPEVWRITSDLILGGILGVLLLTCILHRLGVFKPGGRELLMQPVPTVTPTPLPGERWYRDYYRLRTPLPTT